MSMPNRVKIFPRGYSGGQSTRDASHAPREGDPEINRLWQQYTSPNNQSTTWAFRRQVIQAAKRLLSGRPNWFLSQDYNPHIRDYNYQFVLDTLRFIGTGRRRISIHAWPDLVSNYPVDGLDSVSERRDIADAFERLALTTSIDALIQLWCQQRKGFDDMICTLNILFGGIPIRLNSKGK